VAAVVDSIHVPAGLFGQSYGATVALGTALVAPLHKLILYAPRESQGVVPSEEVERIEDLVARRERDEAIIHAFRVLGLTSEEVEQLPGSPTWSARVATAHTVAREIRAEEAYRVDPERFRGSPLPCSSCWGGEPRLGAREHRADSRGREPGELRDVPSTEP
jgi:hypothetical protein